MSVCSGPPRPKCKKTKEMKPAKNWENCWLFVGNAKAEGRQGCAQNRMYSSSCLIWLFPAQVSDDERNVIVKKLNEDKTERS